MGLALEKYTAQAPGR